MNDIAGDTLAARIERVSQQRLYDNCPQLIVKEQWPSNNSPDVNATEMISCLGSDALSYFENFMEAQNSFWIKIRTGKGMGHFSAGPINNAAPSFRNWPEYMHLDCLLGLYWTGLTLLNCFSFLVIFYFIFYFSFFLFWVVR